MENQENTSQDNSKIIIKKEDWWRPAMYFYTRVTSWIIIPLLVGIFLGKYAKQSMGKEILFFILVFSAFCITCYGIYREIKIYKKQIEKKR